MIESSLLTFYPIQPYAMRFLLWSPWEQLSLIGQSKRKHGSKCRIGAIANNCHGGSVDWSEGMATAAAFVVERDGMANAMGMWDDYCIVGEISGTEMILFGRKSEDETMMLSILPWFLFCDFFTSQRPVRAVETWDLNYWLL